jgi:hypothetical protein
MQSEPESNFLQKFVKKELKQLFRRHPQLKEYKNDSFSIHILMLVGFYLTKAALYVFISIILAFIIFILNTILAELFPFLFSFSSFLNCFLITLCFNGFFNYLMFKRK